MATITTVSNPLGVIGTSLRHMDNSVMPYSIWQEIDIPATIVAKGSALAAADVIEALRIPPNTLILYAFAKKTAAFAGTSTNLTLNVGVTGVNAASYVSAWDYDAAAIEDYGTQGTWSNPVLVPNNTTGDTIDITIATQTGTWTGGKIRVEAVCLDMNRKARGRIAQPKS